MLCFRYLHRKFILILRPVYFIRQFVARYKQKCLQLFKLILLEKKVLFFKSPVSELSGFEQKIVMMVIVFK